MLFLVNTFTKRRQKERERKEGRERRREGGRKLYDDPFRIKELMIDDLKYFTNMILSISSSSSWQYR